MQVHVINCLFGKIPCAQTEVCKEIMLKNEVANHLQMVHKCVMVTPDASGKIKQFQCFVPSTMTMNQKRDLAFVPVIASFDGKTFLPKCK